MLEIDAVSRAARIQGGALGPVLEDQLRPHGYTLRHFPQSFEFSTLGGWLATRSGGHYASVYTHIDDLVESMRVVTPTGISESRRLPGSRGRAVARPAVPRVGGHARGHHRGVDAAAGPAPLQGVGRRVVRGLRRRPSRRCGPSRSRGCFPTNCRLLDAGEAGPHAGVTDGTALLVLGFESADHPVDAWIERAVGAGRDHGGDEPIGVTGPARTATQADAAGVTAPSAWRDSFLRAPYQRDALVRMA